MGFVVNPKWAPQQQMVDRGWQTNRLRGRGATNAIWHGCDGGNGAASGAKIPWLTLCFSDIARLMPYLTRLYTTGRNSIKISAWIALIKERERMRF